MLMSYQIFHNLDARYSRPYQVGDRLIAGWCGEVRASDDLGYYQNEYGRVVEASPLSRLVDEAERVFQRHNKDGRPDEDTAPSMSVGDVVVIGECALSCDRVGWAQVAVASSDVLQGVSYDEVRRGPNRKREASWKM